MNAPTQAQLDARAVRKNLARFAASQHAATHLAPRPVPHFTLRITFTNTQPALETMFADAAREYERAKG